MHNVDVRFNIQHLLVTDSLGTIRYVINGPDCFIRLGAVTTTTNGTWIGTR